MWDVFRPLTARLLVAAFILSAFSCASNRPEPYTYSPVISEAEAQAPRPPAGPAAGGQDEVFDGPAVGAGAEGQAFAEMVTEAPSPGYRLRANDPLIVELRGIPRSESFEMMVDDQGYIGLPYVSPIRAEGLTASELQRSIRDTYIEERIYRHITVNVLLPSQFYFVRGEVRQPGRFPLTSGMTVLKALAAAGGYTEFANPRRINIIRAGETLITNARDLERNPEDDMDVEAGDVIIVPRSVF